MAGSTRTLIAAAALGAVALCLFMLGEDPTPTVDSDGSIERTTVADETATDLPTTADPTIHREAASPNMDIPPWLAHPYLLRLEVRIIDRLGMPLAGEHLTVGPPGCSLNTTTVSTDSNGELALEFASRRRRGEVLLADDTGLLRRIALRHGQPTCLTVTRESGDGLQRIVMSSGTGVISLRLSNLSAGSYFVGNSTTTPTMTTGLHPHARFVTAPGSSNVTHAAIWYSGAASPVNLSHVTYGRLVGDIVVPAASEAPPSTRISGTVFGEDGKPVQKIPVVLLNSNGGEVGRVATDEHGQFEMNNLGRAEFQVRAGGDGSGLSAVPAVTTTGTTPVTLHLRRDVTVRGVVKDADGRPLAKARVTWRASDDSWADATESAADGSFVFANLPGTPGTVMVWRKKQPFPIAFAENVLANTVDLLLQAGATGSLTVQPVQHENLSGFAAVRVWSIDTGIGFTLPTPDDVKSWVIEQLPVGWYRVELFHPATGPLDAGRHWVGNDATTDLGRVAMPEPAIIQVTFAEGQQGKNMQLYRVRPDLDLRVEGGELAVGSRYMIAAGDYALFWVDQAGKTRVRRFSIKAAEEATIRIPE